MKSRVSGTNAKKIRGWKFLALGADVEIFSNPYDAIATICRSFHIARAHARCASLRKSAVVI